MSMQMDVNLKREQIGTLFVRVGAPEGGVRGWVVGQVGSAPKLGMPVQTIFSDASCLARQLRTKTMFRSS